MAEWVERERRTAQLVRACYKHYLDGPPSADKLHALCRLTWITKGGEDDWTDNTRAVVARAMSTLTGVALHAANPSALAKELRDVGAPEDVVGPASRAVGYVNFYAAFRNSARDWIDANKRAVVKIVRTVAEAENDDQVRAAYAQVERLPPLPRPGAGPMPAFNLLTPLLACLDRRGRSPVINSRQAVRRRLAMLGLSNGSLLEQFEGLKGLIGQGGISDAFALDTAEDDAIERAMKTAGSPKRAPKKNGTAKPLADRHDADLEYLRTGDTIAIRRTHNRMTNALRAICAAVPLVVEEGSDDACLFDAMIHEYDGERHLLVEVKGDTETASCRLAVGQLFDYRRQLPDRHAMDVAVLLPEKPSAHVIALLGYVGVKVMWFDASMSSIEGQVSFPPQDQ